jgi:4-hydroxy-tetrahydrodipicolinate synthase
MLRGIFPITITAFDTAGAIDEASLRRVVRFELAGGVDGLGVGGFASEAYKLTDAERLRCAEIVADEAGSETPLIIGMAAGSTAAAITQARQYAALRPAALMVLPPNTMALDEAALVEHYVRLADATDVPLMVQVSPQIMAYSGVKLTVDALYAIAERAPNVLYFKIEGPGSAERIAAVHARLGERATLFGGVGGIGLRQELQAGASGLLPGCGFNEHFVDIWRAWEAGDAAEVDRRLTQIQPLVEAVSSRGHEFSLHARKRLFHQAGVISHATVRTPSVVVTPADLDAVAALAEAMALRLFQPSV